MKEKQKAVLFAIIGFLVAGGLSVYAQTEVIEVPIEEVQVQVPEVSEPTTKEILKEIHEKEGKETDTLLLILQVLGRIEANTRN